MRHTLENNVLTLYLEGELNSFNAENTEIEIEGLVKNNNFEKLVLDFEKLRYISSAGLRIIVGLKQKFNNMTLVKMNDDVYDIFEMVGFKKLFDIERL